MYLHCLCANLAYGLAELNKLTYLLIGCVSGGKDALQGVSAAAE